MNRVCRIVILIAFVALLTAVLAFTQTPADQTTPEAKPASPVAYVYVQTAEGVNAYAASATGKLTLLKGSPFATVGQMEGINGKYLFSVGTTNVHLYAIKSNGVIGKQVTSINTQNYSGSECGPTTGQGAVLDHTGKFFYVQLYGARPDGYYNCAAWQSYQVESNGSLIFLGSINYSSIIDVGNADPSTVPTVSSNDNFAYGAFLNEYGGGSNFSTFKKKPDGLLEELENFTEVDPTGNPNGPYHPVIAAADPTGHLAVLMYSADIPFPTNYGPIQLCSYTINHNNGGIVSTNPWESMPDVPGVVTMNMSPTGKLLATGGAGLQVFHFNGAAPVTTYSSLLQSTVAIDQLGWDNNNHLFALSYETGELYVYTVTPTEISQVIGSPYKVDDAYGKSGLIVVPRL